MGEGETPLDSGPEFDSGFDFMVEQLAVGAEHTVVRLFTGDTYACGANGYGQLCLGHEDWFQDEMQFVESLSSLPKSLTWPTDKKFGVLIPKKPVLICGGSSTMVQAQI